MSITLRTGDAPQIESFLADRLYEYNAAATGHDDGESFTAIRESESRGIEAGISGYTWCGCCYISYLWVAETARGRGIGTELLKAVEQHARAKSCRVMFVATHSFQAPQFYTRMGFEQVASIADHPVGYSSLFFAKRLDSSLHEIED
ncbi:MAG TPA: GNAT family N-acetyltransferase [Steroidobacteraceae bacterium]|nr:GNAT family N-acetyltransferase [Steroidobacteraceae bacterium]